MLTPTLRARLTRAWREGLPPAWRFALRPAALAYRAALGLRVAAYAWGVRESRTPPCRVVAVGNLTVGGTGKTPLVELLARALTQQGRRVVILSRGYGRRQHGSMALVSDGERCLLSAEKAGDEPVLLSRRLPGVPVIVGPDRAQAGAWALSRFAPDVLLLDDGFQQRRLRTNVNVVCLDARAPWGHGGLLPRGSLREPPAALARAHLLVLTNATSCPDLDRVRAEIARWAPGRPLVLAAYEVEGVEMVGGPECRPLNALANRPVLAFAGTAAPEGLLATLGEHGIRPRGFVAFPDHHPYDGTDVERLERRARDLGVDLLLTTEKDAVRMPALGALPVWALRVRLRLLQGATPWWAALEAHLAEP